MRVPKLPETNQFYARRAISLWLRLLLLKVEGKQVQPASGSVDGVDNNSGRIRVCSGVHVRRDGGDGRVCAVLRIWFDEPDRGNRDGRSFDSLLFKILSGERDFFKIDNKTEKESVGRGRDIKFFG